MMQVSQVVSEATFLPWPKDLTYVARLVKYPWGSEHGWKLSGSTARHFDQASPQAGKHSLLNKWEWVPLFLPCSSARRPGLMPSSLLDSCQPYHKGFLLEGRLYLVNIHVLFNHTVHDIFKF